MFYDADRKRRYIKEAEPNHEDGCFVQNITSLFNKTYKFEELYEKDVCDFSREDISNMYAFFQHGNAQTYGNINARLSVYTQWCIDNLMVSDGCNHFKEFTASDLKKYVNVAMERKKYLTREELYDFMSQIMNQRDRFLILCFFEFGKDGNYDEIMNIKLSDFDKANNVLSLCTGRKVKVSDKLIALAEIVDKETIHHMNVSGFNRFYTPSEYVFKKSSNSKNANEVRPDNNNKFMCRVMGTLVTVNGMYSGINATSIAVSGQFDMIYRRSNELGISCEEYVMNYFDELREQYIMSPDNPKKYLVRYGAYL